MQNLSNYLTHPVPPATLSYLQREYASLTEQILLAQSRVMPKLIYSFLQNEGRQLNNYYYYKNKYGWER